MHIQKETFIGMNKMEEWEKNDVKISRLEDLGGTWSFERSDVDGVN